MVVCGEAPTVGLAVHGWRPTGVARNKRTSMRATSPTDVGSIGMMTCTKRERNRRPGKSGTISNGGLRAAAPARLASLRDHANRFAHSVGGGVPEHAFGGRLQEAMTLFGPD